MPRLGPDGRDEGLFAFLDLVALLALVALGHQVVARARHAVGADELDLAYVPGGRERGVRAVRVPHVGPGLPAVLVADQQPCLDQANVLVGSPQICGQGEALDEHRTHREVEGLAGVELGGAAFGYIERPVLERVVGEQRRVQVVRQDAVVVGEASTVPAQQPQIRQLRGGKTPKVEGHRAAETARIA
jgi:hypothetical protein